MNTTPRFYRRPHCWLTSFSGMKRSRRSAFTLMELLLVLAILLVIAGLVVPKLAGRQKSANIDATKVSIEGLQQAIQLYSIDHDGKTPTSSEGLTVLTQMMKKDPQWRGPYLDKEPVDAWGGPFQYRCPGSHNKDGFDIISSGPDKTVGTEDDIGNWEKN